jgi:DNA-directed RNA polymerase specialized sigma subunit
MENNLEEVQSQVAEDLDVDVTAKNIHAYMLGKLKPLEAKVYQLLYIEHVSEIEIAKIMGYKTNEQGRNPGYKRIKNIKTEIIKTVKQGLYDGSINIVNHSNIYGSQ